MEFRNNFLIRELFDPTRGMSRYTRRYAERNPGRYPVYSASLSSPLCHIETYDYDGTYLTWTTNGYGGRVQIVSGKFSINGDRGILLPRSNSTPDFYYLKQVIEPVLIGKAVGRIVDGQKNEYTKVSPEIVAESTISLPVDASNQLALRKMRNIGTRIRHVEALQNMLQEYRDDIFRAEVSLEGEESETLSLGDERYFSLSIGDRVLRKQSRSEGIPVYSANVSTPFARIAASNLTNFEQDSLIWGIDGIFAWNRIPTGVEFATTDHCGRLQVRSMLLDPEYIFYYLRATRLNYGFDRVFRANLENMRRLVEVKIPLGKNGRFSRTRQRKIAEKYRALDDLRDKTCKTLGSLCKVQVNYIDTVTQNVA